MIRTTRIPPSVRETKYFLGAHFGISSLRYEKDGEYNWYLAAAAPGAAALGGLVDWSPGRAVLLAHEWLGLPMVFAAIHRQPGTYKAVFYAHEVATMRPIVESDRGHDTRFYNVLQRASARKISLSRICLATSGGIIATR